MVYGNVELACSAQEMLKALFGGMDGPFPWALALALGL
jgi:hypothetical protein